MKTILTLLLLIGFYTTAIAQTSNPLPIALLENGLTYNDRLRAELLEKGFEKSGSEGNEVWSLYSDKKEVSESVGIYTLSDYNIKGVKYDIRKDLLPNYKQILTNELKKNYPLKTSKPTEITTTIGGVVSTRTEYQLLYKKLNSSVVVIVLDDPKSLWLSFDVVRYPKKK